MQHFLSLFNSLVFSTITVRFSKSNLSIVEMILIYNKETIFSISTKLYFLALKPGITSTQIGAQQNSLSTFFFCQNVLNYLMKKSRVNDDTPAFVYFITLFYLIFARGYFPLNFIMCSLLCFIDSSFVCPTTSSIIKSKFYFNFILSQCVKCVSC